MSPARNLHLAEFNWTNRTNIVFFSPVRKIARFSSSSSCSHIGRGIVSHNTFLRVLMPIVNVIAVIVVSYATSVCTISIYYRATLAEVCSNAMIG